MALPIIDRGMADNYFQYTPREPKWTPIDDATKDLLLNEAQTWLKQLCWDEKATCCDNDFEESYTRAVSELALALNASPDALIPSGAASASAGQVKRQKLGDLEIEYQAPTAGATVQTGRFGVNAPVVLQKFPWLWDVVGCWLKVQTGSSRVLHRECVQTANGWRYW
jgi:hypothetical protein